MRGPSISFILPTAFTSVGALHWVSSQRLSQYPIPAKRTGFCPRISPNRARPSPEVRVAGRQARLAWLSGHTRGLEPDPPNPVRRLQNWYLGVANPATADPTRPLYPLLGFLQGPEHLGPTPGAEGAIPQRERPTPGLRARRVCRSAPSRAPQKVKCYQTTACFGHINPSRARLMPVKWTASGRRLGTIFRSEGLPARTEAAVRVLS